MVDRKKIGARSRTYGHNFERLIVRMFKERFVGSWWAKKVRRSDQTHKAALPDVDGVPQLWPECQTAENPEPAKKHAQAVMDVEKAGVAAVPVVIIRKKRSTKIHAYLTVADLVDMLSAAGALDSLHEHGWADLGEPLVCVDLPTFFDLFDACDHSKESIK